MDKEQRVVYISGTWDLFHLGHLNVLLKAKKLGDKLVVGINTNKYARKLGKKPALTQVERYDFIEALRIADWIYLHWSGDDMKAMYISKAFCRVVGKDWGKTKEQKKALKEMKSEGIEVIRLPRTPGISTSLIKKRIVDIRK